MFASHLRLRDSLPAVLSKRPLSAAVKETLPLTNVSYILKSGKERESVGEREEKRLVLFFYASPSMQRLAGTQRKPLLLTIC